MITPTQIQLVQSTWNKVVPIADKAAELFYGKLFELDPQIKPLFASTAMKEQGQKLMKMIGIAVNGLNDLPAIVPAVQNLGKRHVQYKVKEYHYPTVAAALLWTLEQGLGSEFTGEAKEAWTQVYNLLATTMIDATKSA